MEYLSGKPRSFGTARAAAASAGINYDMAWKLFFDSDLTLPTIRRNAVKMCGPKYPILPLSARGKLKR